MIPSNFKRALKKMPVVMHTNGYYKKFHLYQDFKSDFKKFSALNNKSKPRFALNWRDRYPCLADKTATTGFDRHYVYHPAWAARIIAKNKPELHVDISSTVHFCSLVSAFIPVKFYDYRPAELHLTDLSCEAADLMALPFADNSIQSLSCMHVIEHIGLGRYGDPLDPDGDLKAIAELKRVLAVGGSLLFVVPMGQQKIMFNAHRLYTLEQIQSYFEDFEMREFALIPQEAHSGGLIKNPSREILDLQTYGCGCFWLQKGEA